MFGLKKCEKMRGEESGGKERRGEGRRVQNFSNIWFVT